MKPSVISFLLLNLLLMAGCSSPAAAPQFSPSLQPSRTSTPASTPTPSKTSTTTQLPSPEPTRTPAIRLFSPLKDIPLPELSEIVTNPFQAPRPGQDNGHHGTDFAFYSYGPFKSILGHPVQSVLPGRIAAVVFDRPPYGNMLLIETPFEMMPARIQAAVPLLEPTPGPTTIPSLTCPTAQAVTSLERNQQSVYLLYAHLADPPHFQLGDAVQAGELLDLVGNTGTSSNPHLHLEVRVGPSGASFMGMSHYNNRASTEEMSAYCSWRISGTFRMVDPMKFLSQAQWNE